MKMFEKTLKAVAATAKATARHYAVAYKYNAAIACGDKVPVGVTLAHAATTSTMIAASFLLVAKPTSKKVWLASLAADAAWIATYKMCCKADPETAFSARLNACVQKVEADLQFSEEVEKLLK